MDKYMFQNADAMLYTRAEEAIIFDQARNDTYGARSTITQKDDNNVTVKTALNDGGTETVNVNAVSSQSVGINANSVTEASWSDENGKVLGTYHGETNVSLLAAVAGALVDPSDINVPVAMTRKHLDFADDNKNSISGGSCTLELTLPYGANVFCDNEIITGDGKKYGEKWTRMFDGDGSLTQTFGQINDSAGKILGDFQIRWQKNWDGTYTAISDVRKSDTMK